MNIIHRKMIQYAKTPEKRAELIKKYDNVKIGENCSIYADVKFGSEPFLITLGDNVRITNGVRFITHDGGVWVLRNLNDISIYQNTKNVDLFGKIVVGNNVHIGINSVIMPNVTIGNNVIIGVGAVVTKDIPDNSIVVGVPGKVINTIDKYYLKNESRFSYTKHLPMKEKQRILESVELNTKKGVGVLNRE
ncbi:MAG: acyltransferase [Culicoidibacterales bacterium]